MRTLTEREIVEWTDGNLGALNFLLKVITTPDLLIEDSVFMRLTLEKYKTLRGTNLYVLYNDLCNRDMENVLILLRECPQEILEDACNRQDYSGRELVKDYLL